MLSVEHLSKLYGATYAVQDLSFEVGRGEVVGFLGPNGAGKTTTLRMIAGFLGPTRGRVRLGGVDVADEPIVARRKLGYMPEQCPAYPEMKVAEYLMFRAALKGVGRTSRRNHVADVMNVAHLADRHNALVGHLSKGYRQRLGLADALLGSPELLVLDEPTSGLDPNQVREVRKVIDDRRGRHTILLSTHVLSEVEATCERAIVIHRGQLVAHGSLDELRAQRKPKAVDIVVCASHTGSEERVDELKRRASVVVELGDSRLRLRLPLEPSVLPDGSRSSWPTTVNDWVTELVQRKVTLESVTPVGSSLEDAFASLTSETAVDDTLAELALSDSASKGSQPA